MPLSLIELRRKLKYWTAENDRVADSATDTNLRRARLLCPTMAAINAVHVLVFLLVLNTTPDSEVAFRWKLGLLCVHLVMGVTMAGCALAARRLSLAGSRRWRQMLPALIVALAMVFAVTVVAIDQLVTPSITPFLIACLIISLVFFLRPLHAASLYLGTFAAFFVAMGWVQADAQVLLSNRLNGVSACVMGWALSVLMWRNLTIIRIQQEDLHTINEQLQLKQRELERLTRVDGLTGLFNRKTFVELTEEELRRSRRQGSATSVLVMDLDHFKLINDTLGHPAGDAVLKHVAGVIRSSVRSTDLVGRLGGEEFIVLLPSTSVESARRLAEKLRLAVERSAATLNGSTIPVTMSIGAAGATPVQERSFERLYHDADQAMYQAKERGRNRVV